MVKMVLGSSDTQGQTMASVGETRIASYDQAVSALSDLIMQEICKGQPMIVVNNMV